MYDTNKLRGRIIEKFGSQRAFCNAVGSNPSFVSKYLKGGANLSQNTIARWAEALEIPFGELDSYFFRLIVHETER